MNLSTKSFANNGLNIICQTLMSVILVIKVPNGNTHKRCDEMTYKGCLQCGCLRGEFFKGYLGITKIQGSRILQVHMRKFFASVSKVTILNYRFISLSLEGRSSLWLINTQAVASKDGRASTAFTSGFT